MSSRRPNSTACKHPPGQARWENWTPSLTQGVEHRYKRCSCGHIVDSQQRKTP